MRLSKNQVDSGGSEVIFICLELMWAYGLCSLTALQLVHELNGGNLD